jgi:uncharacterized protein (TIGR03435 family)
MVRRRRITLLASFAISARLALLAQPGPPPEFEVAMVKVNTSGASLSSWDPDHHGNFNAENTSLKLLIGFAYHMPAFLISGPAWTESSRYDIQAKGPRGSSDSQVQLMLQKLLQDRFELRVHRETKETAVYFLELAGTGLKAPAADAAPPEQDSGFPPGQWSALSMTNTLGEFAGSLSRFAGRPVIDHTGIPGSYRLRLWFNNQSAEGPSLPTALSEQLGLRLKAGRAPVESLVVDSARQTPTEN